MFSTNVTIPETLYEEYTRASDRLNRKFGKPHRAIDAKLLMAFALARYDAEDLCAQFDLALRIARAEDGLLPNPVLK